MPVSDTHDKVPATEAAGRDGPGVAEGLEAHQLVGLDSSGAEVAGAAR